MADGATSTISLRGSVDRVQVLDAINSICTSAASTPEEFRRVAKYGLSMMVASDDGLQTRLKKILAQLKAWLEGDVQQLVVVVTCGKSTSASGAINSSLSHRRWPDRPDSVVVRHRHAVEQVSRRWRGGRRDDSGRDVNFDFHTGDERRDQETLERWTFAVNACDTENQLIERGERQAIEQIGHHPPDHRKCDISPFTRWRRLRFVVYTRKTAVPGAWEDSDPEMADSQEVKLRSFTTSVHWRRR